MDSYISPHFTWAEANVSDTAARQGIDNTIPSSLYPAIQNTAKNMESVRMILGVEIKVNSWYRCPTLNSFIGGVKDSQHILGEAVDFIAPAFGTPAEICKKILQSDPLVSFDQLILEHTWVHISFKSDPNTKNRGQVLSLLQSGGYATGLTNNQGIPV